jgi:predicted Rossmann-fold nucleotide-binding protein
LTGGGPGLMQSASIGGKNSGTKVYGIRIRLPFEEETNDAVDKNLLVYCDNFTPRFQGLIHNSDAIVVGSGGIGTLEELVYGIAEMQTGKMPLKPIILIGDMYKDLLKMMEKMKEKNFISQNDISLVDFVETPAQAEKIVKDFYRHFDELGKSERDSKLIIKLNKPIDDKYIQMNRTYPNVESLSSNKYSKTPLKIINKNNKAMLIIDHSNDRNIGVLREIIDYINKQPSLHNKIVPDELFQQNMANLIAKF